MKLKICWLEFHNPYNWADDITRDIGIQNIIDNLPNAKHTADESDDWAEFECYDYIEAKDIKELLTKLEDYDCEVFTVFDENNNRLFTEENITNEGLFIKTFDLTLLKKLLKENK